MSCEQSMNAPVVNLGEIKRKSVEHCFDDAALR